MLRRQILAVFLLFGGGLQAVGSALQAGCGRTACDEKPEQWLRPAPDLWQDPLPGTRAEPLPVATSALPFTERIGLWGLQAGSLARDPCAPGFRLAGPALWLRVWPDGPAVLHAAAGEVSGGQGSSVPGIGGQAAVAQGGSGVQGSGVSAPAAGIRVILLAGDGRCLASGPGRASRLVGPGPVRVVVALRRPVGGPVQVSLWRTQPRPLVIGSAWVTHYYLADERDHEGQARDAPLVSGDCSILSDVPRAFHDDLCIEGSGRLQDGRVVNFDSTCTERCFAALPCGQRKVKVCYRVLDPARYPWGMGAGGRPLVPDRSVAVDPGWIPLGTVLYLPELDGLVPPGQSEPHDGCVRADDVGGAIREGHIDFFVATRVRWRAWERLLPTRSFVTLIVHHPRCAYLAGGQAL